jgi:hypothetical protein
MKLRCSLRTASKTNHKLGNQEAKYNFLEAHDLLDEFREVNEIASMRLKHNKVFQQMTVQNQMDSLLNLTKPLKN